MKISLVAIIAMMIILTSVGCTSQKGPTKGEKQELVLATTTSTHDSGLLGALNPIFEEKCNCVIKVISKGTGAAIQSAKDGDVDLILVHARGREEEFVAEGYGVNRRDVMHNDFVIIGPEKDPAEIKGMINAAEAFKKIAGKRALFLSRGDSSGTHSKEMAIWKKAGIVPRGGEWYLITGQGMGNTITMANEMEGYTLADRGTFYSMEENINLMILVEGDPILYNPYGVIAVNPERYPKANYELAMKYIEFLTSREGQDIIKNYRPNGRQLFYPDAIKEGD